jgi:hypothetical protein
MPVYVAPVGLFGSADARYPGLASRRPGLRYVARSGLRTGMAARLFWRDAVKTHEPASTRWHALRRDRAARSMPLYAHAPSGLGTVHAVIPKSFIRVICVIRGRKTPELRPGPRYGVRPATPSVDPTTAAPSSFRRPLTRVDSCPFVVKKYTDARHVLCRATGDLL